MLPFTSNAAVTPVIDGSILSRLRVRTDGCESFVFVYMGLALFSFRQDFKHWPTYAVGILSMLLARAINVYPITFCINCRRRPGRVIPVGFQNIAWFAGLRGAIAFALALKARVDYETRDLAGTPGAGRAIFTMTLVIVLFTVLGMGGQINKLLSRYQAFGASRFAPPPFCVTVAAHCFGLTELVSRRNL